MPLVIPLAWLQLTRQKLRLVVAIAGVAFAVILMFMQIGFRDALFDSAVQFHHSLRYDLVMLSRKTEVIMWPESFSRRRLHQIVGLPEVASVNALYVGEAVWKNPVDAVRSRTIFLVGFDPSESVFNIEAVEANAHALRIPDVVMFDQDSRPEYGPIVQMFRDTGTVVTEVQNRRVTVVGLFKLGTSFGIDGSLFTSDLNFLRLHPDRPKGLIDLGLIRLADGVDALAARDRIVATIPNDVEVLNGQEFVEQEIQYWNSTTPIGYFFTFGTIMGLVVGTIIVYQILFADVSEHLNEYATLKAIGYTDRYLVGVVIQEAVILAVLGYIPGFAICMGLYRVAGDATQLPVEMNVPRALFVLALTIIMSCVSGAIALRKVRSADPAEVF